MSASSRSSVDSKTQLMKVRSGLLYPSTRYLVRDRFVLFEDYSDSPMHQIPSPICCCTYSESSHHASVQRIATEQPAHDENFFFVLFEYRVPHTGIFSSFQKPSSPHIIAVWMIFVLFLSLQALALSSTLAYFNGAIHLGDCSYPTFEHRKSHGSHPEVVMEIQLYSCSRVEDYYIVSHPQKFLMLINAILFPRTQFMYEHLSHLISEYRKSHGSYTEVISRIQLCSWSYCTEDFSYCFAAPDNAHTIVCDSL